MAWRICWTCDHVYETDDMPDPACPECNSAASQPYPKALERALD